MAAEMRKLENLIDGQQNYLGSIGEAIFEAIMNGMKIGAYRGAKRGAIDGLKNEYLPQGFVNIGETKIGDIVSHISELGINLDALNNINQAIESIVDTYLDRIRLGIFREFRGQVLGPDVVLQLVTLRQKEIGQRLEEKSPRNPLSSGIVAGVRTSLDRALESCLKRFRSELSEQTGRDAETRQEQQQLPSREKTIQYTVDDLENSIRDAVAKVTEDFIYVIARRISGNTIHRLTKELKKEAAQKIENVIRKMTERKLESGLDETAKLVSEEIVKDSRDMMRFVENIDSSFQSTSKPYLSSLTKGIISGKAIAIIATCVLAIGTGVVLAAVNNSHTLNVYVEPPEAGRVEPSGGDYRAGTVATIEAIPAEGWRFDFWGGDVSGSHHTVSIHMDEDIDITAHFSRLPEVSAIYTWWANPETEVLSDIRVRRALCLIIYEENIVRQLFPEMYVEFSPEEELYWKYDNREWSCLDTDIDLAHMLLAEAGYPDGFAGIAAAAPSSDESLMALVETVAGHLREVAQIKIHVEYYPSIEEIPELEYDLVFKRIK